MLIKERLYEGRNRRVERKRELLSGMSKCEIVERWKV